MKRILTLFAAALAVVGCSHDEVVTPNIPTEKPTYYATFADAEGESRTYLDEHLKLLWHNDDRISLFQTTYNEEYAFADPTGSNSGAFNAVESDSWVTGNQTSTTYAVYPYNAANALSNSEVLTIHFAAEQTYAEDSFGRGANTMVAATATATSKLLPFRNAGGYLMLKLYGENKTVKSIELKGNNDEVISGAATAEAKYGYLPSITMGAEGGKTITLTCEEAVTLGATEEDATVFWLVVPPVTFEKGFTITVTDANGGTYTKSTSKSTTIERNTVKPMAALNPTFEGDAEDPEIPEIPMPANNEIWYKSVDGNIRVPYNTTGFGAKYISNEYDTESGYWIISFDGDVTTIPTYAFRNSNASFGITEILLPQSLTTIESNAFFYCLELQNVCIPNNVNTIKDYAFNQCSGIQAFYGKYASSDNRCLIKDGVIISFATSGIDTYNTPLDANAIGKYAFSGATISSLTVTDNIKTIGFSAFSLSRLKCVDLPNFITTIPSNAFISCYELTSCNIPSGVTTIGSTAFQNCWALKTITLPNTITAIGENAFKDAQIETLHVLCDVPDYNDASGSYAYFYLADIGHAVIGAQVTSIGRYAFYNSKIQKLTLGENISSIGEYALYNCKQLTEIYCKSTIPPVAEDVLHGLDSINKIYVPVSDDDSIIAAYKSAVGWKVYANYIEEYEFME